MTILREDSRLVLSSMRVDSRAGPAREELGPTVKVRQL